MRARKRQRQSELQSLLDSNPFLSDQELSERFSVSIQTIRLDRMELGIPELRERVKMVANDAYAKLRSLGEEELVGNLQDYQPGVGAASSLDVTMDMIYDPTMTVRREHIFAQANSLAAFLAGLGEVETEAAIQFYRPVYAGERMVSTGVLDPGVKGRVTVEVRTSSAGSDVFWGRFTFHTQKGEGER
jgi:acyl-coenzyme A thioesterase PaaI-like protein